MSHGGPQLERQVGLGDAVAVALGAIIGAGIFVALNKAAAAARASLPLAVVVAAIVATFSALSAAELGAAYPRVGGPYEFGYELISPTVGFSAGWLYLVANVLANAAFTLGFAGYLQPLVPGLPLRLVAVALAALVVLVNVVGTQLSREVNDVLVILKVGALVLFVLVGLAFIRIWNPAHFVPLDLSGIPEASALMFFAFAGFARTVVIAGEIRDPARTLPRAIIIALIISSLLYLAVATVAVGLVGSAQLASSSAPLRTALVPTGQGWAMLLVSLGGLIAIADVLLTNIWGLSRVVYAMAQRGDLPRILGRIDRRGVPRAAVLAIGVVVVPVTAILTFGSALEAASLGQLVYYALMNLSAVRLAPARRLYPVLVPLAGLVTCIALALFLPLVAFAIIGGALAIGIVYFMLWRRRHH